MTEHLAWRHLLQRRKQRAIAPLYPERLSMGQSFLPQHPEPFRDSARRRRKLRLPMLTLAAVASVITSLTALPPASADENPSASPATKSSLHTEGFEDAPLKSTPEHWTIFGAVPEGAIGVTEDESYKGKRSLRISSVDGDALGARSPHMPIEPGKTYKASAYTLVEAGRSSIYLEYWDNAGTR